MNLYVQIFLLIMSVVLEDILLAFVGGGEAFDDTTRNDFIKLNYAFALNLHGENNFYISLFKCIFLTFTDAVCTDRDTDRHTNAFFQWSLSDDWLLTN